MLNTNANAHTQQDFESEFERYLTQDVHNFHFDLDIDQQQQQHHLFNTDADARSNTLSGDDMGTQLLNSILASTIERDMTSGREQDWDIAQTQWNGRDEEAASRQQQQQQQQNEDDLAAFLSMAGQQLEMIAEEQLGIHGRQDHRVDHKALWTSPFTDLLSSNPIQQAHSTVEEDDAMETSPPEEEEEEEKVRHDISPNDVGEWKSLIRQLIAPPQQHQHQQQQVQQEQEQDKSKSQPNRKAQIAMTTETSTASNSRMTSLPFVSYIKIVEGFNEPVTRKQPGGKDNTKHRLPRQVIELNESAIPQGTDISTLSVKGQVLGTDRATKGRIVLGELGEKRFILSGTSNQQERRWFAIFDDIIVKFSSHLHGQKLALRFTLHDASKNSISFVDSEEFETITKRGKEKRHERKRKRSDDDHTMAIVHSIVPDIGPTKGGQLVKIVGRNFVCPPISSALVKFGDSAAREIHSIKLTTIVCETPKRDPGKVAVTVSLDSGKTFLEGEAQYQYVDPADPNGMERILMSFLGPQNDNMGDGDGSSSHGGENSNSSSGSGSSNNESGDGNSGTNASFGFASQWINGLQVDARGFNIMHHVCARDIFQLAVVLLARAPRQADLMSRRDNYGRTPLFWSLWSGSFSISALLIARGASIMEQDDAGDTPIHIAVDRGHTDALKKLTFWMLRSDGHSYSNAQKLLRVFRMENSSGYTPMDIALERQPGSMVALLRTIESICTNRLASKQQVQHAELVVNDVNIRSGPNTGKSLRENLIPGCTMSLMLEADAMVIRIQNRNEETMPRILQASVPHDKIAFLIMEQIACRAEITLLRLPDVIDMTTGKLIPEGRHPFSMQMHILVNKSSLEAIHKFYINQESMYQFNKYCFCQKADRSEGKSESGGKKSSGSSKQEQDRDVATLRDKVNSMRLLDHPATVKSLLPNSPDQERSPFDIL